MGHATRLTADEATAIEAAVAAVEARSAGEVVIAIVERSGAYAGPRAALAAGLGVGLALGLHMLAPQLAIPWLLLAELPLAAVAWLLAGRGPLLRWLLPTPVRARQARAQALQLFAERGIYATRDATGLLIFISQLERQVIILGDRGIHQHVGDAGWTAQVAQLTAGLRTHRLAPALLQVLATLGDVLAQHFPRRADDINELPDAILYADRP